MAYNFTDGEVLLINKDLKWTSFDVVNKIRYTIKVKKVGHAGTLDPLATGLLIVCTGKKTKTINDLMGMEKEYIAEIELGKTTPSLDRETEVSEEMPIEGITEEQVKETLLSFLGEQEQIPPIYSAIKVDGQRLYKKARKGKTEKDVEIKPRIVNILELELLKIDLPKVTVRIKCSKGTYIRSFAKDLGTRLGTCAYLTGLNRTKIGDLSVNDALTINEFIEKVNQEKAIEE